MQRVQRDNVLGVDLSNWQGDVDFSGFYTSGIRFVYLKATEGVGYVDPYFASNLQRAKAAKLPVGAYHFAYPEDNSAVDEAGSFLNAIQGRTLDLCPVLDLEKGQLPPDELVAWVQQFRKIVELATRKRLILYTSRGYASTVNNFNNMLSDVPLWYAFYVSGDPTTVELAEFGGWRNWVIWQYTESGKLPGVQRSVDLNYARSIAEISQPVAAQYNVFQRQNGKQVLLDYFVYYEDAVAYAKRWAMSSVIKISTNVWMWDNYPKYNVYQKQNGKQVLLRDFLNYDESVAYAKQWAMASVVRISDNAWLWDNYPKR